MSMEEEIIGGSKVNNEDKKANVEVPVASGEAKKSIIEEAREAAAELRKQNEVKKELLKEEEKLIARRESLKELGGDSFAGSRPENREETAKEYKDRILRGG